MRLDTATKLQISSLIMSTSRGVISPLLVVTLSRQTHLDVADIGMLMGFAILCASLYGLYGGHLADRGHCRSLLLFSLGMMAAGSLLLPFSGHWPLALVALLLAEVAYVLFGILLRAAFSVWLVAERRAKAFAQLYTLNNIGFTIGPLLGSLLAAGGMPAPFVASSLLALCAMPLLRGLPPESAVWQAAPDAVAPRFMGTLARLRKDRTLVLFTLGSLLAYLVYGRFSAYLSLCLMPTHNDRDVLHWTSALLATNALTVIALQYPASKLFRPHNLIAMGVAGSGLLALGLAGFALTDTLWQWCGAMVLFTLGEITIVPTAFLFIDHIAPPGHEGSYYGAQQLANLGGAISPLLSGLMLVQHSPAFLLSVLAVLALLGGLFMHLAAGCVRQAPRTASRLKTGAHIP